ncbi:MAG: insulinase family protein, partial [Actinomycetota bacterium]|nr:insulinase family protein [Actinomycetota bacterium]
AEVQRARGALAGASALALEDSDTRMTRLGRSELTLGEFLDLDEALRRMELVTPGEVQDLAGDFVTRPLSIAAVGAVEESMFAGLDPEPTAS